VAQRVKDLLAAVADRIDVLRVILSDPAAVAILVLCAWRSRAYRHFLFEAAPLIGARKAKAAAGCEPPVGVLVRPPGKDTLEIHAVPNSVVTSLRLWLDAPQVLAETGLDKYPGLSARLLFGGAIEPAASADLPQPTSATHYFEFLAAAAEYPELVPLLHDVDRRRRGLAPASPFDRDPAPRSRRGRQQRRHRSVLFLHNDYYFHLYLAAALRGRGWDALSVSIEAPDSPNRLFYHGEDLCLWHQHPDKFSENLNNFFDTIAGRFALVHFYGMGLLGLFPVNWENTVPPETMPWDLLELRRRGVRFSYSPSGCSDGVSQTGFRDHTGVCRKCVWEQRPDVCSDARNLAWARKVELTCDMVDVDLDWPLEMRQGPKYYCEPLISALDPEVWKPDLEIPDHLILAREPGELIVYHAVGNYETRRANGRDIKGTGAVFDAVDRLRAEGVRVRLEFVSKMPSTQVRYLQAQADVVVDQLNYGRYGANAREAMMLGKPTICFIDPRQPDGVPPSSALAECPLVSASEQTVYEVLKDLLGSPGKRRRIGEASRAYALKWHSADACAERFEQVYDRIMAGQPPASGSTLP
jgi:glycosyltransferase involved in cell wall biosynthesis